MEINKQLFEDVLSGKLKGIFVLRNGNEFESFFLRRNGNKILSQNYPYRMFGLSYEINGNTYMLTQQDKATDIIDFIPDTNMKENELTIEIPDGKIVDWDESKKQNKIVLKDKQLTYEDVCKKLFQANNFYYINENGRIVKSGEGSRPFLLDVNNAPTQHQLECILAKNKLATVAKYLNDGWKPSESDFGYFICRSNEIFEIIKRNNYKFNNNVIFKSEEIAQQAIEILGEETVKLALELLGI